MDQFRRLMQVALISGVVAGFVLFLLQHLAVQPLILEAETYEHASEQTHAASTHESESWQPEEGFQRTVLTAVSTTLTGIGFSAILFGIAGLAGASLNARQGALWGLASFACFVLAPAIGLPPSPPAVAEAGVTGRQMWWAGTALATAIGIWTIVSKNNWGIRGLGLLTLLVPHIVGAPVASGVNLVPDSLIHRFALMSILTTGVYWLLVGSLGGFLYGRGRSGLP